jgi:hypothetical protein
MALPAFAQVVDMGQVTLPVAGKVVNFDYDLGHDGIVGIKTGTDAAAGGCFLFEAQNTVDGKKVTLVGAVLGQQTSSPITAVLNSAVMLTQAAFAAVAKAPLDPSRSCRRACRRRLGHLHRRTGHRQPRRRGVARPTPHGPASRRNTFVRHRDTCADRHSPRGPRWSQP